MRTQDGHLLKNYKYYRQVPRNIWNDPLKCGENMWKFYHQKATEFDSVPIPVESTEEEDMRRYRLHEEISSLFKSQQNKQSMEHRKVVRPPTQQSSFPRETTFSDLTLTSDKFLQQAVTPYIDSKDEEHIEAVARLLEQENDFNHRVAAWRKSIHDEFRKDLHERVLNTNNLYEASEQKIVKSLRPATHSCSQRTQSLALPKTVPTPTVQDLLECRGLLAISYPSAKSSRRSFSSSSNHRATTANSRSTNSRSVRSREKYSEDLELFTTKFVDNPYSILAAGTRDFQDVPRKRGTIS
jgi:hypothetical protein